MPDTLVADGRTFVKSEEHHKGKKAAKVAALIGVLQENAGVPCDFDWLCSQVGEKYPVDLLPAAMALTMVEHIDLYIRQDDNKSKFFYCWVGPVNPTNGSSE